MVGKADACIKCRRNRQSDGGNLHNMQDNTKNRAALASRVGMQCRRNGRRKRMDDTRSCCCEQLTKISIGRNR